MNPNIKHATNIAERGKMTPDLQVFGDGNAWQLLRKATSRDEGWDKSTKAYEIEGVGCLVQVSTTRTSISGAVAVAESVTFVPGVLIQAYYQDGMLVQRDLAPLGSEYIVCRYTAEYVPLPSADEVEEATPVVPEPLPVIEPPAPVVPEPVVEQPNATDDTAAKVTKKASTKAAGKGK